MIYHFLEIPKFKHATAAYHAKKRKRNQRENPVWRQEEEECSTVTRQLLCVDNPERREQEQQCDAEAHTQI